MDPTKLQAWWWKKQGFDSSLQGRSAAEVLERTGWARSVAGAGPYLTLWARAGVLREEADAAVARLEIHELPSARGCTYVVPASHFPLALAAASAMGESGDIRTARKLGVTGQELEKLCEAVLRALEDGPLDPEEIRKRTGNAARSLGEAGKKKGLTTTLPIALGMLQVSGGIRRVPVNGRLDQQRYRYALWNMKSKLSPEQAMIQLACLYFEWLGPASVAGFQAFAGIGVRAAKAALEPLNLVPAGELLLLPGERDAFQDFEPPSQAQYALVSSLDSLVLHRRDLPSLIDSGLRDLPSHAIFDRGRLAGLWEFDPASGTIAWNAFSPPDTELRAAVAHTEAYVRDQLGDARSFSLDSPKSRQPRIQALREGAAG